MDAQCTHIAAAKLNAQKKVARDIYVWYAISIRFLNSFWTAYSTTVGCEMYCCCEVKSLISTGI